MSGPLNKPDSAKPASNSKAMRNAATLLVVRDTPTGMEVLMLQRPERAGDAFGGAWVFPGGVVESRDRLLYGLCAGLDDATASSRLGVTEHGLEYYIAAIRECFEEVGILLAYAPGGELVALDSLADGHLEQLRKSMQAGETTLDEICRTLNLKLAVDQLAYHSHWLTPMGAPKRFDTRFFLAILPPDQTALHDGHEAEQHNWLRPADVLAHARESTMKLIGPTQRTLESIAAFASAAACKEHAIGLRDIELAMPRLARNSTGPSVVMPGDPAYAEIARIDPEGSGDACNEIEEGRAIKLSERVIRITAPNGNMMTGPGTNTYLVGGGNRNEWAVIDPGPDMKDHLQQIMAAAPGPIRWIFVTHTHKDHSPATPQLKALTGAVVHGRAAAIEEFQDDAFRPDHAIADGERFAITASTTLRMVHTPGHASNHFCFLLEEEQTLFTGDHLMQGSSVIIVPPDGDMAAYLASLQALLLEDLAWLAPGHGHLMDRPKKAIQHAIDHRLMREAKVVAALRDMAPVAIDSLLVRVYDDVPPIRHPMALRSLMAHLIKLTKDGIAYEEDGLWRCR